MNHTLKAIPGVASRLRAGMLVPMALLLLAACTNKAPHAPGESTPENQARRAAERRPIDPEAVQREVEGHESFEQLRKAACPRRIPDRHEERRPFPAIDILHGLKYVTISDDSSRGSYEKVIELTETGRQNLEDDLEEESDRYVITIARREYLPGLESFENAPGRDDRLVVSFRWQWKPVNELGERLNLFAPYSDRPEHQGRATYVRTTDGWKFDNLWLDRDARDYVGGLYK